MTADGTVRWDKIFGWVKWNERAQAWDMLDNAPVGITTCTAEAHREIDQKIHDEIEAAKAAGLFIDPDPNFVYNVEAAYLLNKEGEL